MLPVSGAEQLSASGASSGLRPVISASGRILRDREPGALPGVAEKQVPETLGPRFLLEVFDDRGMEIGILRLGHLLLVNRLGRIDEPIHE